MGSSKISPRTSNCITNILEALEVRSKNQRVKMKTIYSKIKRHKRFEKDINLLINYY